MANLGPIVSRIPHPQYGNYGGYWTRCKNKSAGVCPMPVDWMDAAFKDHDNGDSNRALVKKLWRGRKKLFKLKRPVYGQLYWAGALTVFSIPALLGT